MKYLTQWLLLIAVCAIMNAVVFFVLKESNKNQIAVVDVIKVFNDYDMKKELEKEALKGLEGLKKQSDSLKSIIQLKTKNSGENKEIERLYALLTQTDNRFQMAYEESNRKINEIVWTRLNPLIDSFCQEHKYEVVIGANGMGSVLYMTKHRDITGELMKYINDRYAGK